MSAKPDFYAFERSPGTVPERHAITQSMARRMRGYGATWLRLTVVNDLHRPLGEGEEPYGFWAEGWRERPKQEAEFDPPLTEGAEHDRA